MARRNTSPVLPPEHPAYPPGPPVTLEGGTGEPFMCQLRPACRDLYLGLGGTVKAGREAAR
jgi:hypothetical protein